MSHHFFFNFWEFIQEHMFSQCFPIDSPKIPNTCQTLFEFAKGDQMELKDTKI